MFKLPKWVLPNNYPAFYDTESATAIEMTAKLYGAMSSFADEYNKFADDVNKAIEEFVAKGAEDYLVFQMKMEQLYSDFVKVVELKYQSQDVYLQGAVAQIIAELPVKLEETINNMYKAGEFDELVYNSVANLKADFDRIVANNNTFQSNINKSFSNLVTDMEIFKQTTTADFNELSASLNAKFDELVLDAQSADMQKAIYDKNNSGVVDDAENLGGQLPAYYAKQQDLDTTNANMETLNISVNSTISQIETAQNTATAARNTADAAKTAADSALSQVGSKLGVNQTAADSSQLGGRPAGDYALSADAINTYTHAKTGVIHYLNGSGDNIKFIATADFAEGDIFYVNGTEVEHNAKSFISGDVIFCIINNSKLYFVGNDDLSNFVTKEEFNNINNGMDLLWTNASPTSGFAAQTLSLALSAYRFVIIYVRSTTSSVLYGFSNVLKKDGNENLLVCGVGSGVYRRVCKINNDNINFLIGVNANDQGNNTYCVPIEIYGIK